MKSFKSYLPKLSLWLLLLSGSLSSYAQELNARVVVNGERTEIQNEAIFNDMQRSFGQFLNDRKWTEEEYAENERIQCNIIINLRKSSRSGVGSYEADVQIQSIRPIYSTNYESIVFNFADKEWTFEYNQSQPLNFNENNFSSNISSLLAFYAYIIIGLDADTFEKGSGDPYYLKAQNIVNNATQTGYPGWEQFSNKQRNRYYLVEGLLNQQMSPVRDMYYDYHMKALDVFLTKQEEARQIIVDGLKNMRKVHDLRPNSVVTIAFLDAKAEEITQIFSQGPLPQRREVYNILSVIDPSNKDKYQSIIQ
ncbi:DUF4835 family protein [Cytophagales bacterium LB-30]|uniref:DUF4835 family protein n=1 Tax=Shiella aurantiaca TaxID=3058365 RepID=A0ABT8F7V6_9BACT|nr:DUF4835 family protein [Shiella aurantiaca]MDN4166561.1 DUF4835 family protein [Shiella aurantiaca]